MANKDKKQQQQDSGHIESIVIDTDIELDPNGPDFDIAAYRKAIADAGNMETVKAQLKNLNLSAAAAAAIDMEKYKQTIKAASSVEAIEQLKNNVGQQMWRAIEDPITKRSQEMITPLTDAIKGFSDFMQSETYKAIKEYLGTISALFDQYSAEIAATAKVPKEIQDLAPFLEMELEERRGNPAFKDATLDELLEQGFDENGKPTKSKFSPIIKRAKKREAEFETTKAQVAQAENLFYNVPNSTASNLIFETLGAGANIADLPRRKQQFNHSSKLEVVENGKQRQVALKTQKASVTVELADIDKLTGSNKPAKKLFVLALIKANEQAVHNGKLTRDHVSFPLQELIDTGFYSTPQSARKGFYTGMDALTSLKVKGHIQQTKKKGSSIDALEVLFTGARIERGQCTIFFNDRINWSFIIQYFTILPRYYFRLPNRASDLLYYIFYLARQHTRDIENKGYFTISFRAIQERLQLPSEVGNHNPDRTIKQPIEDAIEQIENCHGSTYNNMELQLLPVYADAAKITEYLDAGYLKISLSGEFAKTFIAISKDTAQRIEAAQKRQDRITEKAIAINTAKKIEGKKKATTAH